MLVGVGHRNVLIVGPLIKESVEHVLLEGASYDSQRQKFFEYLQQVLPSDAYEAFVCSGVFDKTLFC